MLDKNIKHILFHSGNLKTNDHLLLIFDNKSRTLCNLFIKFSKNVAKSIQKYELKKQNNHGDKISKKLEDIMQKSSLIICMTKYSLAHTQARIKASKKGARFLSLPGYSKKFILDKSINVNYKNYYIETKKITKLLSESKDIFISSPNGTKLFLKTLNRKGNCCPGFVKNAGDLGSPPDIEANISPIENFSHGKLVIDGSVADPKIGLLKEHIFLNISKGKITNYYTKNRKVMKNLDQIFKKKSKKRKILAEFGIGINHKSRLTGNMLTDEGCRGTVHFGFGSNSTVGGKNFINFHLDFIMKKPTVIIKNKKIILDGKIQKI